MTLRIQYLFATALLLLGAGMTPASATQFKLVDVQRIWTGRPHAAFTDLIRFDGRFLCAFREGSAHASPDGVIRVLGSDDGAAWDTVAVLTLDGEDLRDPKLSVMPDGRLCMIGGAARYERPYVEGQRPVLRNFVAFSSDGADWSTPRVFDVDGLWVWRLTWVGDTAYGVGYRGMDGVSLVRTRNGIDYTVVAPLLAEQSPTEATLRFDGDANAWCLIRREGEKTPDGKSYTRVSALLGRSTPPYEQWTWTDVGLYLGGPNLLRIPSGAWVAAGRTRRGPAQMALGELDAESGQITDVLTLPSGGDCSYPGLVWHDGLLWLSYYSSHEGATSIYLARVAVE